MKTEKILVVKRDTLFGKDKKNYFEGFRPIAEFDYRQIINNNLEFLPRDRMEEDPSYQQIIPYCIFHHGKNLFYYKRTTKGGEKRLHDKISIGIGGHVNTTDKKGDVILEALKREFEEEIIYEDKFDTKLIGFLNDDSNMVGKVHFGLVFLLSGSTPDIKVKETEMLEGKLAELKEIDLLKNKLESWSALSFDHVKSVLE